MTSVARGTEVMEAAIRKLNKKYSKAGIGDVSLGGPAEGNFISGAHDNSWVKGAHDLTGVNRNAKVGKRMLNSEVDQVYGGTRNQLNNRIDALDTDISRRNDGLNSLTGKALEDEQKAISALESQKGAMTREKYKTYGMQAWEYAKNFGSHTFLEGSMGDRAKKVAMYGGVYGAASVGLRGASGGGATYNNQGERDIAGIPFI